MHCTDTSTVPDIVILREEKMDPHEEGWASGVERREYASEGATKM